MLSKAPSDRSYNVVISRACVMGASGLVGTALCASLRELGVPVSAYSRSHVSGDLERPHWDPGEGQLDQAPLEDADAVINLAGESLTLGRWSEARKRRFYRSRVDATRLLCERMAQLARPPRVLVNASAIGYYGDQGEDAVTEDSPRGQGFLAELCEAWEQATEPARDAGVRVVLARFGVVLSRRGGALGAMLPAFRLGLGGPIGGGRQYMSWVAINDAVRAIRFCVATEEIAGPVNIVAPEPARNAEFTAALARVLHRPARIPVPAFAVRAALGSQAAEELLLGGANVRPLTLERAGFRFDTPRLEDALAAVLDRS